MKITDIDSGNSVEGTHTERDGRTCTELIVTDNEGHGYATIIMNTTTARSFISNFTKLVEEAERKNKRLEKANG